MKKYNFYVKYSKICVSNCKHHGDVIITILGTGRVYAKTKIPMFADYHISFLVNIMWMLYWKRTWSTVDKAFGPPFFTRYIYYVYKTKQALENRQSQVFSKKLYIWEKKLAVWQTIITFVMTVYISKIINKNLWVIPNQHIKFMIYP